MRLLAATPLFALVAGCGSDDVDQVFITASWTFRSAASNTAQACPAGYVVVLNVEGDAPCNARGDTACVTRFDCDGAATTTPTVKTSDPLARGVYRVRFDILDDQGALWAASLPGVVDLTLGDRTFARQILVDGGVFGVTWALKDGSQERSCADAGVAAIVVAVMDPDDSNGSTANEIECIAGDRGGNSSDNNTVGYTYGYPTGMNYTVSFEAVNELGQTRGSATDLEQQVITAPNGVTYLGPITITLDP